MIRTPSIQVPGRRRPVRLRAAVAGAVALVALGLSGCGEPDDDSGGGDGGGGYLAQQLTGQKAAPESH